MRHINYPEKNHTSFLPNSLTPEQNSSLLNPSWKHVMIPQILNIPIFSQNKLFKVDFCVLLG